jgi:hypothetical protein
MLLRYMLCAYAKHLEKPQNYQKIAAKDAEKMSGPEQSA